MRSRGALGKYKAGLGLRENLMLGGWTMADIQPDPVLAGFRASIDNIDAALIHMLAERFRITKAVGAYKATHALPPSDPGREERQIARLRKLAEDAQLDPDFGEKFLRFIIDEVIRHHEQAQDRQEG